MEPGANWFYFLSRAVAGFFCWCLFRPTRQGVEKVPESGGFLLAVNHSSFLDPVMAGTNLKRPLAYMARSTLFRPAPIGMALRGMNALPLEREGVGISAFRSVIDHLSRGGGVLVFPEGTRSRSGRLGRAGARRIPDRTEADRAFFPDLIAHQLVELRLREEHAVSFHGVSLV